MEPSTSAITVKCMAVDHKKSPCNSAPDNIHRLICDSAQSSATDPLFNGPDMQLAATNVGVGIQEPSRPRIRNAAQTRQ